MTRKFYRDELNNFNYPDRATSGIFRDEQKISEMANSAFKLNQGTRRMSNTLQDSVSSDGTTIVVQNTVDLQNAFNNISLLGGKIYLKAGTYNFTEQILGGSPITLEGESYENTTISFSGTAANLVFQGTDVYTTGTIDSIAFDMGAGAFKVTGNGTSWLSITDPTSKQIFFNTRWYKIAAVVSDTILYLAEGYGDNLTTPGLAYRIAAIKQDIKISNLTITGSTGDGLSFTDCRNVTLTDVVLYANGGNGVKFTNVMGLTTERLNLIANGGDGFNGNNMGFGNWQSTPSIGNGGLGFNLTNIETIPITSTAGDANRSGGFKFTNCKGVYMVCEAAGNTGIGVELASGNDNIMMSGMLIKGNTSDGIKFTDSSDKCKLYGSKLEFNGGYGVNIANANCIGNVITTNDFTSNTSGSGTDSGTDTIIRGNYGWDDNASSSLIGISTVTASDNLKLSADTERGIDQSVYTKIKEIRINLPGTVRVKFSIKTVNGIWPVYGRIYVNGVAVGTERSRFESTYEEYTEDITVTASDLIQFYGKREDIGAQGNGYVKDFRIYYDKTVTTDVGTVITD